MDLAWILLGGCCLDIAWWILLGSCLDLAWNLHGSCVEWILFSLSVDFEWVLRGSWVDAGLDFACGLVGHIKQANVRDGHSVSNNRQYISHASVVQAQQTVLQYELSVPRF